MQIAIAEKDIPSGMADYPESFVTKLKATLACKQRELQEIIAELACFLDERKTSMTLFLLATPPWNNSKDSKVFLR